MNKFLILFALLFISFSAQSGSVPIAEYYKYKEEPFMISYVWGVSGGIMLSATINAQKGGNRLFCIPVDVEITNEESVGILERELYNETETKKYSDETSISMVYLSALEKMYPCE